MKNWNLVSCITAATITHDIVDNPSNEHMYSRTSANKILKSVFIACMDQLQDYWTKESNYRYT